MEAAVVVEPGMVECRDMEMSVAGPGEVLVKVAYCGICGSDIPRVLSGTAHGYPLVLGHEFSGVVEAVGQGVDPARVGSRIAGVPLIPCGTCSACVAGDFSLCSRYSFIGSRRPGALARYVSVPADNVVLLPDQVTLMQGAFFEPATVARHAIDIAGFKRGASAVVVGCGTVGIFLAQMLQGMGASRVLGLVRREDRLQAARAAGIGEVVDTSASGWRETLMATTFPEGASAHDGACHEADACAQRGFDYVFDTSGDVEAMTGSWELAGNRATVCMVGTPKRDMVFSPARWEILNRRELTVKGSWMSYSAPFPGAEWTDVARSFAAGTLKVVPQMIDEVCTLDGIPDVFERLRYGHKLSGKVLCRCNET